MVGWEYLNGELEHEGVYLTTGVFTVTNKEHINGRYYSKLGVPCFLPT